MHQQNIFFKKMKIFNILMVLGYMLHTSSWAMYDEIELEQQNLLLINNSTRGDDSRSSTPNSTRSLEDCDSDSESTSYSYSDSDSGSSDENCFVIIGSGVVTVGIGFGLALSYLLY